MPERPLQEPAPDDATGRYAWPAGRRLARDLAGIIACGGERVCDLGCGSGVVGQAALAAGASAVAFLDGSPQALELARLAVGREPRASFHEHRWGEDLPGGPFRIVLGGDILYREAYFPALLRSVGLGLAADGVCLLSDPRRTLEEDLPSLASAEGLDLKQERHSDFTLVRLRRLAGAAPARPG